MIDIFLNGQQMQLAKDSTVEHLLAILELENKRLAVEINQQIIPRSEFGTHVLEPRDKVEIVQAIGGG